MYRAICEVPNSPCHPHNAWKERISSSDELPYLAAPSGHHNVVRMREQVTSDVLRLRCMAQEEMPMVLPPVCQHQPDGSPPSVSLATFRGQARAYLLSVGIIRPAADVTAIDVNAFLSAPHGAPASAGKVAEADKGDVARFLNR